MSKAFVREPDGEVPGQLPEIPVPPGPNPVTAEGHTRIVTALDAIERRLADEGGLPERADADRLHRERRYWTARLATARITAPPADPHEVGFGSQVTVAWPGRGQVVLHIVGDDEADPTRGLIGWRAPVAAALIGSGMGDDVTVPLAGRDVPLVVLAVRNQQ
ncbi:GreA/GreB family elongation factor [Elioraea sp.]|uniref:GreA/GreB family elongation factor n=1 Tax=Elioraea sp. TaxID=2185103 RepID=UPI0025BE6DBB|nr:GreA/GreB family elongation factor [Elioraea sp.]